MQSPEQEPVEENGQQQEDAMVKPDAQPLYEFPPEQLSDNTAAVQPQPAPITQVLPAGEETPVDEEAIRKGLVYPPPPSYYQNMQPPAVPPALPPVQPQPFPPRYGQPLQTGLASSANPGVVPPSSPGNPQAQNAWQGTGMPPTYPPPFVPPYERRVPARKSRRWLWITLSIVGAVLLLSCGLCSWAAYSFFSPVVQGVSGSLTVVDNYYSDLQSKDYTSAFSLISTQYNLSSLTQSQYVQEASSRDSQYGAILSYTPGQPAYASDPNGGFDFTRFTISVDVKRPKLSYTTTLYLRKIGNDWKITNFDSI